MKLMEGNSAIDKRNLRRPQKFERNINENIRRNGERVWIDWTNKMVFDEQGK